MITQTREAHPRFLLWRIFQQLKASFLTQHDERKLTGG